MTTTSPAKVDAWKNHVQKHNSETNKIDLSHGYDLTVSPSAKRASFPYSILPPLRHIDFDTLVKEVLRLPDVRWTAVGGIVWGAGAVSAYSWLTRRGASLPMRGIFGLVVVILVLRWITGRLPPKQRLSASINVSSNPAGVCNVTGPVVTLSNSHAGTHADTPQHFLCDADMCSPMSSPFSSPNSPAPPASAAATAASPIPVSQAQFDPCCYTGDAIMLDVSRSLASRNTREIDEAVITDALMHAHARDDADASPTTKQDHPHVWRLILCTKRLDQQQEGGADEWSDNFAYLSKGGAEHIAKTFPYLLLLATDSPSVDRVDATPIKHHAHGELWKHRIAIVENVDCSKLYSRFAEREGDSDAKHPAVLHGAIQCVFNDAQKFDDARGCNVIFYPK